MIEFIPQILTIIFLTVGVVAASAKHGEDVRQSFWFNLGAVIFILLLWWGGFWG